jgi:RNA polymerase sigma-70 factor (ECF subfamily)
MTERMDHNGKSSGRTGPPPINAEASVDVQNVGVQNVVALRRGHLSWLRESPTDVEARKMLIAITSGDRAALSNLYMSYCGILAHYLSQVLGCDCRVSGVINDTFMSIWERARNFKFESRVSVWILSVAHGHASRVARWHTTRGSARCEAEFEGPPHEPGTPTEMHRSFLQVLGRLPSEHRAVLMLCYRMGYSVREIASITDSTVETVDLRMWQARQQLLRYLR